MLPSQQVGKISTDFKGSRSVALISHEVRTQNRLPACVLPWRQEGSRVPAMGGRGIMVEWLAARSHGSRFFY